MTLRNAAWAGILAAALAPAGCGPSEAAKAYSAYEGKVEPLLDREIEVWKKLVGAIEAQSSGETADEARLEAIATKEALPFYTAFSAQASALGPVHETLAEAHAALVRYAEVRTEFAKTVAEGRSALAPIDPALDKRNEEFERATAEYAALMADKPADPRFAEVVAAQQDFGTSAFGPLLEGRMTAKDVEERIRSRTLRRLAELRAEKYADDAQGKALKAAVFAAHAFFETLLPNLPAFETSARLKVRTESLAREGDEQLKRFREAMKAARQRQ